MRKLFFLGLLILFALPARAQTPTTFTITVVAPPTCTVTLVPNPVSTSGAKLYAGQAGTINFNVSACSSVSSAATATWDGTATPTTFVASPVSLSVPISATQATVGTHNLILTIPLPMLSMTTPVTLPNAKTGQTYSADLGALSSLSGGVPPYQFALDNGSSLPPGLSLSSSGLVTGIPSSAGSFTFGYTVNDSSGLVLAVHRLAMPS